MKNCTNCGNQVEDEAVFCDACGSKLEVAQQQSEEPSVIEINQVKADDVNAKTNSQPEDPEAKRRKVWLMGSIGSVLVVVVLMMPMLFGRISGGGRK